MLESPYTRYPVFRESLDDILGILHIRALVAALNDHSIASVAIEELLRPAYVVPETKDLGALLAEFRKTNQHMAVVVDEYGATAGIVTLEDLLEEIVGDIEDEFDLPDESVERIDDTTIRIDGSFTIDDFNEQFDTELDTDDFHTVAGFVFGHLGRAAEIGDEVSEGRLALPRARDERHADPAARGGVPARPGRRGRHARSRLASRLDLTAPAPRLLALRRGDGRDRRRDRDVVRRDRLAGLRDPRRTRSISGSSGSRCSSRCRCSPCPAGHLADRYPRRTILALAIGVDAAVALGLLLVTRSGADETWPFFALAFGTGVASALGAPAGRALTPSLVPEPMLVRALAQRSVAFQLSVIGGPALGGLLFAIRPELVYAVSAAFSLLALVGGARSPRRVATASAAGRPTSRASSAACDSCAARRCCSARSRSTSSPCSSAAPSRCCRSSRRTCWRSGRPGSGVLRAAPAAGALVAAIVLVRRPIQQRAGRTLLTVVALYGVTIVVFGLSETMWLSLAALAAGGAVDMVSMVLRQTILPLVTPDELRGRVNAVEMVFISASNELGAFESGVAAALVGAVPAVVIGGVATIGIAVVWTRLFPDLARVDRLDELRPAEVVVS